MLSVYWMKEAGGKSAFSTLTSGTSSTYPACQGEWLLNTMTLTSQPQPPTPIWFSLLIASQSFTSHTAHLCPPQDPSPHLEYHLSIPTKVLKIHLLLSDFFKQLHSGLVIPFVMSHQRKRPISHYIILPLDSWNLFILLDVYVTAHRQEFRLPKSINFHILPKLPAHCIATGVIMLRGKESEHKTICSLLHI